MCDQITEYDDLKRIWDTYDDQNGFSEVIDCLTDLQRLKVDKLWTPRGEDFGEPERIASYSIALRQVFLHRAISLFEGALREAMHNNSYTMILSIRGLFESAAALGYLHYRLDSMVKGNLQPAEVDRAIFEQLLGSKDIKKAPNPKQVLSMLEYADKTISKHILDGTSGQHKILMESYDFLCEFSHPNFHSNILSFEVDHQTREIKFRHGQPMREVEFRVLAYLLIAGPVFGDIYERIGVLAADIE